MRSSPTPQHSRALLAAMLLLGTVDCGGSSATSDPGQSGTTPAGGSGGTGGSSATMGGSADAGADAAGDGGSMTDGSVGELGVACGQPGSLACAGKHQKLTLVCSAQGVWETNGTCGPGEFCQSAAGVDQGICLPEVEECRGEPPGARVCREGEVRECGVDAVDSLPIESCTYGCMSGMCRDEAECLAGWKNCDAEGDCETNVMSSSADCGACGHDCAAEPNADGTCVEAACACKPGYADCTDAPGCETATNANAEHCGECGRECGSGMCVAGRCTARVFVTSTLFKGNLGGLSGADQKCQALADAANLGGQFRAWLSDANTPITSRFQPSEGRYVRVDGVVIANDWSELALGKTLQNPISVDETGTSLLGAAAPYVWSGQGTDRNGHAAYCADWTSNSEDESGLIGSFTSTVDWQKLLVAADCIIGMRLYCFEVLPE